MSHHPIVEARDTTAMTSLFLRNACLPCSTYCSSTPARAKRLAPFSSARLAPRPDGPLTHFASPRGEICRLRARTEFVPWGGHLGTCHELGQFVLLTGSRIKYEVRRRSTFSR